METEDWQEDKAGRAAGGPDPKLHWCRGVEGQLCLKRKSSRCFQCPSPPPLSLGQTASTSVPFSTEELPPSPQLLFLVANHQRLLCPCHPDSEPLTCSADMAHPDGVPRSPPFSLSFPVRNGPCFLQFGEKPPKVPTCSALPSPSPLLLSKWTRG